jgi:cytidyltransferase-like protein
MDSTINKKIIVVVSGGFDPLHAGHVRLIKEAKALGDKLIVILNNDNWLNKKKGYVFMPENYRKEIIEAIRFVDEVVLTSHPKDPDEMSVCRALENGGDRHDDNIPEVEICKKISCKLVFNSGAGGKIQSSSWLVEKYISNTDKR